VFQHPELEGGSFFWKAGPVGVLLIHGLTATTSEVRPLAKRLLEHGYTVAGPLLPGHGTTPTDLSKQKWHHWAEKVNDTYHTLEKTCQMVFVGGESLGGLLALYLANKHPKIKGVMVYAPALHILGIERAGYLAPFIPTVRKKPSDNSIAWQGYTVNSLAAVSQLYRLQKEIRRILPEIKQPALILQGCLDQTIDPQSSKIVYDLLGSKDKNLHWLEHSGHVILLDRQFDEAFQLTLAFLAKTTAD
jgi:carboxylesterase